MTALNKTVGFECGLSSNDLLVMYFVRGLLSKESVSDFSLVNNIHPGLEIKRLLSKQKVQAAALIIMLIHVAKIIILNKFKI